MKKSLLFSFVLLLFSCGKTTYNKISNDWTVDSFQSKQSDFGSDVFGDSSNIIIIGTGNDIDYTENDYYNSVPSTFKKKGKINSYTYSIKKDGTWSSEANITYTTETGSDSLSIIEVQKLIQSGKWSFVKPSKGDDFKEKERILFNIMVSNMSTETTSSDGINQNVTDDISNQTYLVGEKTRTYTIIESTKEKLSLSIDLNNTNYDSSNQSTNTEKFHLLMNLKAK